MHAPDFRSIIEHARTRQPELVGPQGIPHTRRIHKCECCQDSGVVQVWKLNKWAKAVFDEPLDPITSQPVYCRQFLSCGQKDIQVFAEKDVSENGSRTATVSLFTDAKGGNSAIGALIASGKAKCLTREQSKYIHDRVLEYREILATTSKGQNWIEEVKEAGRKASTQPSGKSAGALTHIGDILGELFMPPEPQWDDLHPAPTVETISPKDLDPAGQKPAVLRGNSPVLPERSPDTAFSHEHLQLRHEPVREAEDPEFDF